MVSIKDMPMVTIEQCVRFREMALLIESQRDRLHDNLMWTLPMAKGYAASHDVGNNFSKVTGAQELLYELEDKS